MKKNIISEVKNYIVSIKLTEIGSQKSHWRVANAFKITICVLKIGEYRNKKSYN